MWKSFSFEDYCWFYQTLKISTRTKYHVWIQIGNEAKRLNSQKWRLGAGKNSKRNQKNSQKSKVIYNQKLESFTDRKKNIVFWISRILKHVILSPVYVLTIIQAEVTNPRLHTKTFCNIDEEMQKVRKIILFLKMI